jgi:hypothetical protein
MLAGRRVEAKRLPDPLRLVLHELDTFVPGVLVTVVEAEPLPFPLQPEVVCLGLPRDHEERCRQQILHRGQDVTKVYFVISSLRRSS